MLRYREQMKQDIKAALNEEFTTAEILQMKHDDEMWSKAYDTLWIDDSVTGNASGSYFCNRWLAEEMIGKNLEELTLMLIQYPDNAHYIAESNWEALDVCIRCNLLGEMLFDVINEW